MQNGFINRDPGLPRSLAASERRGNNVKYFQHLPRKSVRLTCENKSVYTEFVPTFRNFDFYLGGMLTYEHFKIVRSDYFSCGPLCPPILRGLSERGSSQVTNLAWRRFRVKREQRERFEIHLPGKWLKPRQQSGLDYHTCAKFARQRKLDTHSQD